MGVVDKMVRRSKLEKPNTHFWLFNSLILIFYFLANEAHAVEPNRSLKLQNELDDGAGILRQLYPGLRQNIYVELAEAFKTYETLRRIRDVSAARGLPKNDFRIMMRRSEASPLDTIDEYGRVIKKRSEPRPMDTIEEYGRVIKKRDYRDYRPKTYWKRQNPKDVGDLDLPGSWRIM